jgi:S1-C subfamily serine protease
MIVPIDLLKPIIGDLTSRGQVNRPPRPWLGVFATELGGRVIVAGLSEDGPAARADLQTGDIVLSVAGRKVSDLAGLFRGIWALGNAGVSVPLTVEREGRTVDLSVLSSDRRRYLKAPRLH